MFMSTSSGRHVRGEMQTSADAFCLAVGHKFRDEITVQGRAPASVATASVGAAAETSAAVRKCRVNILTRWRISCYCVSIRVAQCLAVYYGVDIGKVSCTDTFVAEGSSSEPMARC